MTSAEIRQSFLDYFAKQGHTIVPSASLLPDYPGLLFTNAGMNQFVPIFLGDRAPDVSHWAGVRPAKDTRAADTQKCIRAGGKHNDLEDVGYDTYHHTMFEMLGNWSFGDYFKRESLTWGWELLTKVWGIPAKRLFATVYAPDKTKGDPAEFDHEAAAIWTDLFRAAGLDPAVHIVHGNKKDNFWMMGDTGPCGPCSEIHFNLLPSDDEAAGRALVNSSSPRCIEIWNHVFIQFNANADGTFAPLAAKHVDTGMGFERVAGIHATTHGFKDFSREPSNYNADVFTPLFAKVAELSGKTYRETVPATDADRKNLTEQERTDIAFRVLADHARTVSCAIADGIHPGNEGRNYVIRRILRRGILYGNKLGLKTGFFEQLVAPVVESLGPVFPELVAQQDIIRRVIRSEEESFGRALNKGLEEFQRALARSAINFGITHCDWQQISLSDLVEEATRTANDPFIRFPTYQQYPARHPISRDELMRDPNSMPWNELSNKQFMVSGKIVFELYDTYGFPLDMTQLLASERGLTVDTNEFERLMEEQRNRGRASTKKEIITAATEGSDAATTATLFTGYDPAALTAAPAQLIDIVHIKDATYLVFDHTPFYAEMGGQLGDAGTVIIGDAALTITDTIKDKTGRHLHRLSDVSTKALPAGNCNAVATLSVDLDRRRAIQRHHTATHLLHWALRQVVGTHLRQAGSLNATDRLRFDFSHFEAVPPDALRKIETLVNTHILENAPVQSYETDFDQKPEGTLAFFGEKYGKRVRVVDIGGYSRELCGGTHVATTGEIGYFKIISEGAIAAGTRRIEALAGAAAHAHAAQQETRLAAAAELIGATPAQFDQKLAHLVAQKAELEKKLTAIEARAASTLAADLAAKAVEKPDGTKWVDAIVEVETPEALRHIGSQIQGHLAPAPAVIRLATITAPDKASLAVFANPPANKLGHQAGALVRDLCQQIDGKGGGKPDFAMGGGKNTAKLRTLLSPTP
ncbi:alanine--tRNA ligase [Geminisphaera colitermitum]|uniref:alanine--tRNA ligase n=1 Tax=Geminisphaera colitermitum TaxID=1148786 RepID=UPI0005B9919D|nr:alanine--tRNA ligase [Geminisphaera colitermitum]